MPDDRGPLSGKQTLLLILLPMLSVFVGLRLYLQLVQVRHIYPGGYLVHHFFIGSLVLVPAAFVLAFSPRRRSRQVPALVAVGIASAMILDEFIYLVATKATDEDYVSRVSLLGAVVSVSFAVVLLLVLYAFHRD
jgi:hypothetical protein